MSDASRSLDTFSAVISGNSPGYNDLLRYIRGEEVKVPQYLSNLDLNEALKIAIDNAQIEVVQFLVHRGADFTNEIFIHKGGSYTPSQYCRMLGMNGMANFFDELVAPKNVVQIRNVERRGRFDYAGPCA